VISDRADGANVTVSLSDLRAAIAPEIHRTAPYTFAELALRWGCSAKTVARRVGTRYIQPGHEKLVRPATLLRIEEAMEVGL